MAFRPGHEQPVPAAEALVLQWLSARRQNHVSISGATSQLLCLVNKHLETGCNLSQVKKVCSDPCKRGFVLL